MRLTNEEFARLERVRTTMERTKVRAKASTLQLAFEHMEAMYRQQQQLVAINQRLLELGNKSWCYRTRRFVYGVVVFNVVKAWKRIWGVKPAAARSNP